MKRLHGASRLGMMLPNADRGAITGIEDKFTRTLEKKNYELTDHLGNVRSVITDMKLPDGSDGFLPEATTQNYYYPFGMERPLMTASTGGDYRFGYNGKENDRDWNKQDYGFRTYDPRVGRWMSRDGYEKKYPSTSTYSAFANNPILCIDIEGNDWTVFWKDDKAKEKFKLLIKTVFDSKVEAVVNEKGNVTLGFTGEDGKNSLNHLQSKAYSTLDGIIQDHDHTAEQQLEYLNQLIFVGTYEKDPSIRGTSGLLDVGDIGQITELNRMLGTVLLVHEIYEQYKRSINMGHGQDDFIRDHKSAILKENEVGDVKRLGYSFTGELNQIGESKNASPKNGIAKFAYEVTLKNKKGETKTIVQTLSFKIKDGQVRGDEGLQIENENTLDKTAPIYEDESGK